MTLLSGALHECVGRHGSRGHSLTPQMGVQKRHPASPNCQRYNGSSRRSRQVVDHRMAGLEVDAASFQSSSIPQMGSNMATCSYCGPRADRVYGSKIESTFEAEQADRCKSNPSKPPRRHLLRRSGCSSHSRRIPIADPQPWRAKPSLPFIHPNQPKYWMESGWCEMLEIEVSTSIRKPVVHPNSTLERVPWNDGWPTKPKASVEHQQPFPKGSGQSQTGKGRSHSSRRYFIGSNHIGSNGVRTKPQMKRIRPKEGRRRVFSYTR